MFAGFIIVRRVCVIEELQIIEVCWWNTGQTRCRRRLRHVDGGDRWWFCTVENATDAYSVLYRDPSFAAR